MKSSLMLVLALVLSCGNAKSTTASAQSPESQTCAASQVQAQVIIGERDWYSFKQSGDERIGNIANAVGQLIIPKVSGGVCTGTIINDDTILTNQHCVTYPEQAEGVSFTVRDLSDEKKNLPM